MRTICVGILLVMITRTLAVAQSTRDLSTVPADYSNAMLGFRYLPPSEMRDVTERAKAEIQAHAETLHTRNTLGLLLAMISGPDEAAPGWHSLTIETYPRKAFSTLDDAGAEAKMSAWVMGLPDVRALSHAVTVSRRNFTVSAFQGPEATVRKTAVVWTTVCKDQLVSFAFSANSSEQLKSVAKSMKSVQFF